MAGSEKSFSSVLRSSIFVFIVISMFGRLHSGATPQDYEEGFLERPFPRHIDFGPFGDASGPREDLAFLSRDGSTFPQELESAFILEDESQATQVWPRVILDYMRQQLRYRGRTKKSAKRAQRSVLK